MHPPGPATPHTSSPTPSQVLHDLDLVVVDSAGVTHTANGNWSSTNTSGMSSPNGVASFSEANNVEKVAISIPVTGTYSILITAGILTESTTQLFALAVTGGGRALRVNTEADESTSTTYSYAYDEDDIDASNYSSMDDGVIWSYSFSYDFTWNFSFPR